MIKLHTTRTQEYPGGGNEGWAGSFGDAKHDALVAHAYQEAIAVTHGGLEPDLVRYIEARAAELLKSWGVEP